MLVNILAGLAGHLSDRCLCVCDLSWWVFVVVFVVDVVASGAGWALPTIPSIPMSWSDAKPLMEALTGPLASTMAANDAWVGGIPDVTYRVGPAPAVVRVKTKNKFAVKPIWNVIGTIPGAIEPDRWVRMLCLCESRAIPCAVPRYQCRAYVRGD